MGNIKTDWLGNQDDNEPLYMAHIKNAFLFHLGFCKGELSGAGSRIQGYEYYCFACLML